jgi:hypothetical protein
MGRIPKRFSVLEARSMRQWYVATRCTKLLSNMASTTYTTALSLCVQATVREAKGFLDQCNVEVDELRQSGGRPMDPSAPMRRSGAAPPESAALKLVHAVTGVPRDRLGFEVAGPVYKHVVIKDPR